MRRIATLTRQGSSRGGLTPLTLQRAPGRARAAARSSPTPMRLPFTDIPASLLTRSCRSFPLLWWRQLHACTARLRKSYGDHLLGRAGTVLALPNMVHLFTDKFARLGARRFTLASVFLGTFDGLFFRHRFLTFCLA